MSSSTVTAWLLFDTGQDRASVTVPGVGSRRRLRDTTVMVTTMRQRRPDLVILPAHDPGAADRLAQATGQPPVTVAG